MCQKSKKKKKKKINCKDWAFHAEPSQAVKNIFFSFFFHIWGLSSDLLSVWFKAGIWLRLPNFWLKRESSCRVLGTLPPSDYNHPTFVVCILQFSDLEGQNHLLTRRLELPGAQCTGLGSCAAECLIRKVWCNSTAGWIGRAALPLGLVFKQCPPRSGGFDCPGRGWGLRVLRLSWEL